VVEVPQDQWYRVEGTHEAIISRETFEAVQRGLKLHTKTDGSGEVHLLAGLVKCARCGSTMSKCSNGKQAYLRCRLYAGSGRLCTRHSVRLDQLIDLVSDRIRHYVRTCYQLDAGGLRPPKDTRRAALEQEERVLAAQVEKRGQALKTLYLDRAAGILGREQFMALNQTFLEEKSHLEQRLDQVSAALAEQRQPEEQADLIKRAQKLLELETVPRELVLALVEKIEIGEKNPETGQQEVKVTWKF